MGVICDLKMNWASAMALCTVMGTDRFVELKQKAMILRQYRMVTSVSQP